MRKVPLWIILAGALAVRLAVVAAEWQHPQRAFTPDSAEYHALARTLLQRGQFSRSPAGPPELFRTPGYPLLLAGVYAIAGASVRAVLVVQALLDTTLCYLVYLLGRRVVSQRAGLLAAALQAVSTVAVVSVGRVLSDGPFTVLFTAALLAALRHFRTGQLRSALVLSALLAAACYVRPVGLYFAVAAMVVLACRRRRFRQAMVATACFAACAVPWVVRNGLRADYWGFSTLPVRCVFHYQGPYVIAHSEGITVQAARRRLERRLAESIADRAPSRGDLEAAKMSLGMAVLRRHPGTYAAMHLRGNLMVWAPGEAELLELLGVRIGRRGTLEVLAKDGLAAAVRHYTRGRSWVLALYIPLALLLLGRYLLAGIAAVHHGRWPWSAAGWLIALALAIFTLAPGPFGHPRFRVPVMPLLNVATAAGVAIVWDRLCRRGQARPTITTD